MIKQCLQKYWIEAVGATLIAIVLGFVSAIVAALIGPSLKILMGPVNGAAVSFEELFGDKIAVVFQFVLGRHRVEVGDFLSHLPMFLIVVASFKALAHLSQWFIWENLSEKASRDIRQDLIKEYLLLDPRRRFSGSSDASREHDISSAITTDVRLMREYIIHFYGGLPREGLQIFFLMVTLVLLSPHLFLIFLFGVAPLGIMIAKYGRSLRKRAQRALTNYSDLSEWVQQRMLGIETIKHYQAELNEVNNMVGLNAVLSAKFARAARVKARTSPTIEFIAFSALAFVLYLAIDQVYSGEISTSVQLSFFSTLAMLSQSAGKLGRYLNSNREGVAAMSRIKELREYLVKNGTSNLSSAIRLQTSDHLRVNFDNVSAKYDRAGGYALRNFTFSFLPRQVYALYGPSGSGKTTIFNSLLGLVDIVNGSISVQSSKDSFDELIGYVPQTVDLFPGSLRENVCYPNLAAQEDRFLSSLDCVGLGFLKERTNDGYEKIGMSGGQVQRVHLARVFYHRMPIVLIDEGTSALDPENETVIYKLIRRYRENCLIIMIAHRMSAFKVADQVLLLKQGRLVASGTPEMIKESETFRTFSGEFNSTNNLTI